MLQLIVDKLVYDILGVSADSKLGAVINFFLYDSIKILLLLAFMIAAIGFLRTFLSQNKIKDWLSRAGGFSNLIASAFGAVTPFCSCSSIPIFLSFIKAGIPLGITFSFLITSPLINEYLIILMLGFFGWKVTLLYVINGIVIGVAIGILLGKLKLNKYLVQDITDSKNDQLSEKVEYKSFKERVAFGLNESRSIVKKLWVWVLVGVGIGAVIHNFIPEKMIQEIIGKTGVFSVPIATLLGVPMYGSCAAIVPIAVALFQKGFPLGTALAFMMAVSALSLPEAILLRRAMKLQLIAIFFGTTALGIIFTGYLFNLLQILLK